MADTLELSLQSSEPIVLRLEEAEEISFQSQTPFNVGTTNYDWLRNRPKINGVTLTGNKNQRDLYIVSEDTVIGWNSQIYYIPKKGEIVVYTDATKITDDRGRVMTYPEIKIGDGNAYLVDLPFVGAGKRYEIMQTLQNHMNDDYRHVTQADRDFWNAKLNYSVSGDTLTLTRN